MVVSRSIIPQLEIYFFGIRIGCGQTSPEDDRPLEQKRNGCAPWLFLADGGRPDAENARRLDCMLTQQAPHKNRRQPQMNSTNLSEPPVYVVEHGDRHIRNARLVQQHRREPLPR